MTDFSASIRNRIVRFVFGEDTEFKDLDKENQRELVQLLDGIYSDVSDAASEFFDDHSFLCDSCERQVGGPPREVNGNLICPGCFDYNTLVSEVYRRGLKPGRSVENV